MKKETKEIIKLSVAEVLNRIADGIIVYESIFSRSKNGRKDFYEYFQQRDLDKTDLSKKIYRLKQQGLIREVVEGKKYYLELTKEGDENLLKRNLSDIKIDRPDLWDRKWRVIIYDLPENDRITRNAIRSLLYKIGFEQIQKSVFVYPFECNKEIDQICQIYGERENIKYMIADIIEGEKSIIEKFMDKKILTKTDLIENK